MLGVELACISAVLLKGIPQNKKNTYN